MSITFYSMGKRCSHCVRTEKHVLKEEIESGKVKVKPASEAPSDFDGFPAFVSEITGKTSIGAPKSYKDLVSKLNHHDNDENTSKVVDSNPHPASKDIVCNNNSDCDSKMHCSDQKCVSTVPIQQTWKDFLDKIEDSSTTNVDQCMTSGLGFCSSKSKNTKDLRTCIRKIDGFCNSNPDFRWNNSNSSVRSNTPTMKPKKSKKRIDNRDIGLIIGGSVIFVILMIGIIYSFHMNKRKN